MRLSLGAQAVGLPFEGLPFELRIGERRLHIYPDQPLAEHREAVSGDLVLLDPDVYFSRIAPLQRLKPGNSLALNRKAEPESHEYLSPGSAFGGYLQVSHAGRVLTLKNTLGGLPTSVMRLPPAEYGNRIREHRKRALRRVEDIFGGPLEILAPDKALATLGAVNHLMGEDSFRPTNSDGQPGGLVQLPGDLTPVVIGDLHGEVENLLKILSEGAYLESMEKGEAALVLLGDAVHCQRKGQLASMDNSVLIMDLIFRLKLRFPRQVFLLLGNHDSFSPEVLKGGVPQGALWEKHIVGLRGEAYRDELENFYRQSPLVAVSEDFAACHAGPPIGKVSRQTMIDIRRFPKLLYELTWTHIKTTSRPAGYTRRDVEAFRKALGLGADATFIVGHFPLSRVESIWFNVGHTPNHHIVYSANTPEIGMFTRIAGEIVPQIYTAEPLLKGMGRELPPS